MVLAASAKPRRSAIRHIRTAGAQAIAPQLIFVGGISAFTGATQHYGDYGDPAILHYFGQERISMNRGVRGRIKLYHLFGSADIAARSGAGCTSQQTRSFRSPVGVARTTHLARFNITGRKPAGWSWLIPTPAGIHLTI